MEPEIMNVVDEGEGVRKSRPDLPNFFFDLAKIIGGVVRDSLDVGDYRITLIIERKIDDKTGILIENISVDKKMNSMQVGIISRKLKELINKESKIGN